MNVFDEMEPTRLHQSFSEQIDKVCDDFEAAWQNGNRIRIETCLQLVPKEARSDLLRELIEIELETRKQEGEPLSVETFLVRFPNDVEMVKEIFQNVVSPRRLGDYELLELLGQGGMGVVYRARQVYLHQTVAIKILPEQYMGDTHAVSRFRREMQLIGGLKHSNIVQAYNAGEANGVHYLVMEYVAGVTLQRLIAERISHQIGGISVGAACEVIRQAALGLQHAHQRGLVHRDIKPGNLMLDRNGMVKVLDLGLGKFQADVRKGDQQAGPLTQVGTTMGTVDYMAPEQWDDPTTVSISADIYSLGCTLYFLLCGTPPFGGKNFETNRAKLMAHIVSEPPPLTNANPNVPLVLQNVFTRVMAKEPQDRFREPVELANALIPFANIDELVEIIPEKLFNSDPEGDNSSSSLRRNDIDTAVNRRIPNRSRRSPFIATHSKPWYRHQEFYAILGVVNIIFAIVAIWYFAYSGPANPIAADVFEEQSHGTLMTRVNRSECISIMADLVELPGLSGSWWFSEMPWYLPCAREAIGKTLLETNNLSSILGEKADGYLDTDTIAMQKWLRNVVEKSYKKLSPAQKQLIEDLIALADSNFSDDDYRIHLETAYEKYAAALGEKRTAADVHTEAILLQSLNAWKTDMTFAENAKAKFEEAIKLYSETDEVAKRLRLFCQYDLARLLGGPFNDLKASSDKYSEIYGAVDATELFKVDLLLSLAINATGKGEYNNTLFEGTDTLLKKTKIGAKNHPLAAHIAERYAWSLIDQWKIKDAKKYFAKALDIRKANSRENSNPFADIYVFHNKHGLAMVTRYSGDVESARAQYAEVVAEIADKYNNQNIPPETPGQLRYYRELRERFSNSQERYADCELFSGAASNPQNVNLVLAEKLYSEAISLADGRIARITIGNRLCMVRALLGRIDDAHKVLSTLNEEIQLIPKDTQARFRVQRLADTAAAVIDLCSSGEYVIAGQQNLRQFLNEYSLSGSTNTPSTTRVDSDRNRRDIMEFWLFYAETLLRQDMLQNDAESAKKDSEHLLELLKFFSGPERSEMFPFVRRFNEIVIHAMGTEDPVKLFKQVLQFRKTEAGLQDGNEIGSATRVLFYFSAIQNFVIFLPGSNHETRGIKIFPLALTREQIKQAANTGRPIEPDQNLIELFSWINEDRKSGRIVNIFWNDQSCWTNVKDALIDADWPFTQQCELKQ